MAVLGEDVPHYLVAEGGEGDELDFINGLLAASNLVLLLLPDVLIARNRVDVDVNFL